MAKQLQLRRGTTQANALFTGAQGEITMDTEKNLLRVHDGTTPGGFMIDPVVAFQAPTAQNNYTWYRKYASGWVEQGGVYDRGGYSTSWNTTILLPVTMADSNYTVLLATNSIDGDHLGEHGLNFESRTTTQFAVYCHTGASGDGSRGASWEVKGLAA